MEKLIDTHCHLDDSVFDADRSQVIARASARGVYGVVIPAVGVNNFSKVRDLAHALPGGAYAIGIHPMYVHKADAGDLALMRTFMTEHLDDPKLVAIGEIGLDFFVKEIAFGQAREDQILFYREQLRMALEFDLPVLLHVRKSQDELLKWLRRDGSPGGIAHAFNGSFQQAQQFLEQDFALGMGGAMTMSRALQIRRLASQLPQTALVLETDAPDIAPAWLAKGARNEPGELKGIGQVLAQLRESDLETIARQTTANAKRVLPRGAPLWS